MGEGRSIWVGKDERHGVLAQPRERCAARRRTGGSRRSPTRRGRAACRSGAGGRRAVFIEDGDDRSDVWLLDLESGAPPARLTTGRDPMPYWEDTTPRLSPDGSARSPTRTRATCGSSRPRAGRRAGSSRAGSPLWIGDEPPADRRGARGGPVHAARRGRPGRPVAAPARDRARRPRRARRRGRRRRVPGRHRGRLHVHAARGPEPQQRDPRGEHRRPARCAALTGVPDMHDGGPRWSPDGATIAYASERSGFYELHLVDADGHGRPAAHERGRRPRRARLAPRRQPPRGRPRGAQPLQRSSRRPRRRQLGRARARGRLGRPPVDRCGRRGGRLPRPRDPAGASRASRPASAPRADPRARAAVGQQRAARGARGRDLRVVRRPRDPRAS